MTDRLAVSLPHRKRWPEIRRDYAQGRSAGRLRADPKSIYP